MFGGRKTTTKSSRPTTATHPTPRPQPATCTHLSSNITIPIAAQSVVLVAWEKFCPPLPPPPPPPPPACCLLGLRHLQVLAGSSGLPSDLHAGQCREDVQPAAAVNSRLGGEPICPAIGQDLF